MKRTIYICAALITVLSTTAALTSCGKQQVQEKPTTTANTAISTEKDNSDVSQTEVIAEEWYDEQFTNAPIEITTNKSQQADFDSVTLPPHQEGEDTTTAKTDEKQTSAKPSTTSQDNEPTAKQESTTNSSSGGLAGTLEPPTLVEAPRPSVTYFDKYVKSVLNSNSYTATVNGNFRGYSATVNIYKNNGSTAYQISTRYHGVPLSCRYFYSGGNVYIIVPSMRSYSVVDVADPIVGALESMVASESVAMKADGMTYCGVKNEGGYIRESYKDSSGTAYHYYFNSDGLSKIEEVSSYGKSTIGVKLTSGVSAGGVFSVPSGYTKVDVEVLVDKLESM